MFEPSPYQQALFDFVTSGRGDAAVNAVAGSGKSTTIVHASRLARGRKLFVAFGKANVADLKAKLPRDVDCRTLNSLGLSALRRAVRVPLQEPDRYKYHALAQKWLEDRDYQLEEESRRDTVSAVGKLVSYVMSNLAQPTEEALFALCNKYGINPVKDVPDQLIFAIVRDVLATGEKILRSHGIQSFDDQIYFPVKWNVKPNLADFIFVDECQDLSAAKLALVLLARAPGGRIVFVGDPYQAIFGFAGADCNSFASIVEKTGATVLPLSVCYRCDADIVAEAQKVVPHIEARPTAPKGLVRKAYESQIHNDVRTGDLVLCRTTAPLVRLCFELIARRIPARVKGKDVGAALVTIAKTALGRRPYLELPAALSAYEEALVERLSKRPFPEDAIDALRDQMAALKVCFESFHDVTSIQEFERELSALFTDGRAAVELATVHRAKGLEADRCFILEPALLGRGRVGDTAEQKQQEKNLDYVAKTRAKHELVYVYAGAPVEPQPQKGEQLALVGAAA